MVCDHEGVPRGTATGGTTRYRVQVTAPRRGGWRAWGPGRGGFERALADPPGPAIVAAEIASEHRRGAGYVRVTVAMTVDTRDAADALAIAWDAFTGAADDLDGWDVTAAVAEVRPGPPQPQTPGRGRAIRSGRPRITGYNRQESSPGQGNARSDSGRAGDAGRSPRQVPSIDLAFRHMGLSVQHTFEGPRGPGEPCGKAPSFFSPVRR